MGVPMTEEGGFWQDEASKGEWRGSRLRRGLFDLESSARAAHCSAFVLADGHDASPEPSESGEMANEIGLVVNREGGEK